MQNIAAKQFSPADVITALLAYFPPDFNNAPENIHQTLYKLEKKGYSDRLGDFKYIEYSRLNYSP